MTREDRAATGARGERLALRFLRRRGYRLVARNFRCPEGELDLVVRRGATLVVVEVRTVTQDYLASPLDSVTAGKRARVARAARRFVSLVGPPHGRLRFDLIGVTLRGRWRWTAEWRRDAFDTAGRLRPGGARG
jgi:putative endonuclease